MNPHNRDANEGEGRKDAAFLLLESHRECYIRNARRALLTAALENGVATADDVRAVVELPKGVNPKLFGAAPQVLAKAGLITADGFTKTTRPEAHARPVSVWRLRDAVATERWLATHPPLTPLTTAADLATESETPTGATAGASVTPTPTTERNRGNGQAL